MQHLRHDPIFDIMPQDAEVAEVVDASVSKTDGDLPRAGSIPAFGTRNREQSTGNREL